MNQGGSGAAGRSGRIAAIAFCARGAALLLLAASGWSVWERRGALMGALVSLGFAVPALRLTVGRSVSPVFRHRATGWGLVTASLICVNIWRLPAFSTGAVLASTLTSMGTVAVIGEFSRLRRKRTARKSARKTVLAALATDLQRLATLRMREAEDAGAGPSA